MNRSAAANLGAGLLVVGLIWAGALWVLLNPVYALVGLAVISVGLLLMAYGTGRTTNDTKTEYP